MEKGKTGLLKVVREISEKKISYIFTGITVAVAIVLIAGAIRPTVITITRINAEISEKETTEKALTEKDKCPY